MSARVVFEGLEELLREMAHLPEDLRNEARAIVVRSTEGTASDWRGLTARGDKPRRYRGARHLGDTVRTSYPSQSIVIGKCSMLAPHAHIYAFGTKTRQTARGYNRGQSPAHRGFVEAAARRRTAMHRELIAMVRTKGFVIVNETS